MYLYNETNVFADLSTAWRLIRDGRLELDIWTWRRLLKIVLVFQGQTFESHRFTLVKEWPPSSLIVPEILAADPTVQSPSVR